MHIHSYIYIYAISERDGEKVSKTNFVLGLSVSRTRCSISLTSPPPPTPPFHATLPHSLPLFVVCISVRFEQNGGPMMHKGNTYENLRYAARITIQTCRSYLERHNTHTLSHTHIAPHTDNTHTHYHYHPDLSLIPGKCCSRVFVQPMSV
jgi:hypothetical protein